MRDDIEEIISTEILLRHRELDLINNELGKCQAALEQLRRCHLIPYPVNAATLDQRANLSNGNSPALQTDPHGSTPKWAPGFGISDGPYARHFARWLLPHPCFDGPDLEATHTGDDGREMQHVSKYRDRRATRTSTVDASFSRSRPVRGASALQKPHALAGAQPETRKMKSAGGPVIVKRADGQTVQLVCVRCGKENFNSVQGYLNHCRIAHKCEYKSHEEAALKSGRPVEASDTYISLSDGQTATPTTSKANSFAHPNMTKQQTYIDLQSRVKTAAAIQHSCQTKPLNSTEVNAASKATSGRTKNNKKVDKNILSSSDMPHLSRLLQSRSSNINLSKMVQDAKTPTLIDDYTSGEESDVDRSVSDAPFPCLPVRRRIPVNSTSSLTPGSGAAKKASHIHDEVVAHGGKTPRPILMDDNEIEEPSLSPKTVVSNNAPSLVSDDGEYDDSDEGSSVSDHSDQSLEEDSVTDVAEIVEEHETRVLRRTSAGVPSAVRIRKDDSKQVSFVGTMGNERKTRRRGKAPSRVSPPLSERQQF